MVLANVEVEGATSPLHVEGGLRSVRSALELLDLFADGGELGVSQVARRLGVAKSTAHRLLSTLVTGRFVVRSTSTGRYQLGLHVYELGLLAKEQSELRCAAVGVLEDLQERTGRTVHLGLSDGADVVYLERLQAARTIPLMAGLHRRMPSHCSASGKAIAAFDEGSAEARRLVGFPQMTPCSIARPAQFDRILGQVRQRGFAVNRNEARVGVSSVAVAVRDDAGRSVGAVSLVTTTDDLGRNLERHVRLVASAARSVGRAVGLVSVRPGGRPVPG
jgi:DNA-binding IclR family transcriptional regulator